MFKSHIVQIKQLLTETAFLKYFVFKSHIVQIKLLLFDSSALIAKMFKSHIVQIKPTKTNRVSSQIDV